MQKRSKRNFAGRSLVRLLMVAIAGALIALAVLLGSAVGTLLAQSLPGAFSGRQFTATVCIVRQIVVFWNLMG